MGKKKSMSELKQDSEGINHWVPGGTPRELLCRSALYGLVYDAVNGYDASGGRPRLWDRGISLFAAFFCSLGFKVCMIAIILRLMPVLLRAWLSFPPLAVPGLQLFQWVSEMVPRPGCLVTNNLYLLIQRH